jgi:transcriptional regulator with XRE-family HTH domain
MTQQERIRLARRAAGMSQNQLAQVVGVQRSAVSHWEAPLGKNPSVSHLREIAMVTGIQFEWLATGRGEMPLSKDVQLDSIATAEALLVEDPLEFRLIEAFRAAPLRTRLSLLEVMEELAAQRLGRAANSRRNMVSKPGAVVSG